MSIHSLARLLPILLCLAAGAASADDPPPDFPIQPVEDTPATAAPSGAAQDAPLPLPAVPASTAKPAPLAAAAPPAPLIPPNPKPRPPAPKAAPSAAAQPSLPELKGWLDQRRGQAQAGPFAQPDDKGTLRVAAGRTYRLPIATGQLNRIVTPFADPKVLTVSPVETKVEGAVVYVATDSPAPASLFVADAETADAISPELVPRDAAPPGPDVPAEGGGLKIRVLTGASNSPDKQKKDREAKAGEKPVPMIRESINDPDRTRQGQRIDPILPTGSILSGTIITGLDAPTASQAMQNPFPALLRIKHEAILPNRFRMDIRECFLVAGGYGDLSSERAYLRAESLSCVKSNGEVIDATLDAFAVGEDGKAGVRGRVVSKNGQIIANSLLSGFIAGIGKAFVPTRSTPVQLNPQAGSDLAYQWPSPEMVGAQAFVGGVRGAAEQIAEYYLEMAKNMFPVVEVDAGRKVDFVLLRGVALKPGLNGGGGPRTAGLATAGQMLSQAGNLLSGQGQRMGGNPGGGGAYGGMGGYARRGQALSATAPLLNGSGNEALLK
jgi:hypothetical protein